ncbi:hypothetical protein ATN88_01305 [Enterovibrio coralii]|uniref:Uncharacterized protein n=1 Tax=Enterovibrio coralii TaxID=294935 RepID=A0A135I7G6_9GAMM|nr:hypothetical protein ATN88_01305 [Enterovibrio coralii]
MCIIHALTLKQMKQLECKANRGQNSPLGEEFLTFFTEMSLKKEMAEPRNKMIRNIFCSNMV